MYKSFLYQVKFFRPDLYERLKEMHTQYTPNRLLLDTPIILQPMLCSPQLSVDWAGKHN